MKKNISALGRLFLRSCMGSNYSSITSCWECRCNPWQRPVFWKMYQYSFFLLILSFSCHPLLISHTRFLSLLYWSSQLLVSSCGLSHKPPLVQNSAAHVITRTCFTEHNTTILKHLLVLLNISSSRDKLHNPTPLYLWVVLTLRYVPNSPILLCFPALQSICLNIHNGL